MVGGVSRRAVLGGVLASASVVNVEAGEGPVERVRKDAERLAASMQAIHGGEWKIRIDHHACLVIVARHQGIS